MTIFFWLDILATATMVPVILPLFGVNVAVGGASTLTVSRLGRVAKAASRAGKFVKFLKMLMQCKKCFEKVCDDGDRSAT